MDGDQDICERDGDEVINVFYKVNARKEAVKKTNRGALCARIPARSYRNVIQNP